MGWGGGVGRIVEMEREGWRDSMLTSEPFHRSEFGNVARRLKQWIVRFFAELNSRRAEQPQS